MIVWGTMEAGKNSIIYMGLILGPNKTDKICGKTMVTGMMHRGSTVLYLYWNFWLPCLASTAMFFILPTACFSFPTAPYFWMTLNLPLLQLLDSTLKQEWHCVNGLRVSTSILCILAFCTKIHFYDIKIYDSWNALQRTVGTEEYM
jgi:hypothetical protein